MGLTAGCAGNVTPSAEDVVTISPAATDVRTGDSQSLSASYPHDTGKKSGVTWTVNGIANGNASVGTISVTGPLTANYVAPASVPSPNAVTIAAVADTNNSVTGTAMATLLNPIPIVNTVSPSSVSVGSYTILVNGADFVAGAVVTVDGNPVPTTFLSSTELSATGTATQAQLGTTVTITVTNPNPGSALSGHLSAQVVGVLVTPEVADRFLEQSTFGPDPNFITIVQQQGLQNFVGSQFAAPVSIYPTPASTETDLSLVQQRFFTQAIYAPDQLRQRIAFALGQIFVIAGDKINDPQGSPRTFSSLITTRSPITARSCRTSLFLPPWAITSTW